MDTKVQQERIEDLEKRVRNAEDEAARIHNENLKLRNENKTLQKDNLKLQTQNDTLAQENDVLAQENAALKIQIADLQKENENLKQYIDELQQTLNSYADAKAAKKPEFKLHYDIDRNKPENNKENRKETKAQRKARKKQQSQEAALRRRIKAGRIAFEKKLEKIVDTIDVYPEGLTDAEKEQCILHREQLVWRLFDGQHAQYIRYRIFAPPDATELPQIEGVRNSRSEFGTEIHISLAFLVFVTNISIDKACVVLDFFSHLPLSKGQADSLLNQLAADWEKEYENIAGLITAATILYIDETGWKIGKKSCYTWVFNTSREVLFKVGVGRGKDVLTELLGEKFAGKGVTDDYAAYDDIFAAHQLCWAHPLRKAIELMLRNPDKPRYRRFMQALFNIYYDAVSISKDETLDDAAREEAVGKLKIRLHRICYHRDMEIVTEKKAAKAAKDGVVLKVTPPQEAKYIRLHKQLAEKTNEYFLFVLDPNVKPDNNCSERLFRDEAETRKAGRTSKTPRGAKRRGVIKSVFSTLKLRMERFRLSDILKMVFEALKRGVPLFAPPPPGS